MSHMIGILGPEGAAKWFRKSLEKRIPSTSDICSQIQSRGLTVSVNSISNCIFDPELPYWHNQARARNIFKEVQFNKTSQSDAEYIGYTIDEAAQEILELIHDCWPTEDTYKFQYLKSHLAESIKTNRKQSVSLNEHLIGIQMQKKAETFHKDEIVWQFPIVWHSSRKKNSFKLDINIRILPISPAIIINLHRSENTNL